MLLSLFNYCINFGIFPDAVPVNPSSCCLSPFHLSYVAVSRPCCLSEFNLKRALLEKSEEQLPKKLLASCLPTVVYSLMWNFSASFSYFRSRGCFWQDQLVTKIPWLEQSTCKEMGGSWWWGSGEGWGSEIGQVRVQWWHIPHITFACEIGILCALLNVKKYMKRFSNWQLRVVIGRLTFPTFRSVVFYYKSIPHCQ